MEINIHQGNCPTLKHAQVNIVIDVIRAFTVAHYAFIHGAKEIWLARTQNEAFLLKENYPDHLLAGEVNGLPIEGFDLDNSPKTIVESNIDGKTLIQKTTNGVTAALNALDAEIVLVTGFTNAKATAEYAREICGPRQSLLINVVASHPSGDDDLACAQYISALINNEPCSASLTAERIRNSAAAEKFFDDAQPEFDKEDIGLCVKELDGTFVMQIKSKGQTPIIERVDM